MAKTSVKSEAVQAAPAQYKYLCPACTNEVTYDSAANKLSGVYCPHCHETRAYDPQRWVKIG